MKKKLLSICLLMAWVNHSYALASSEEKPSVQWEVTVEAKEDASALFEALDNATDEELESIESLRISGTINLRDFEVISKMLNLSYLDMENVQVVLSDSYTQYFIDRYGDSYTVCQSNDNEIPNSAFFNKQELTCCILPSSVQTIGVNAFEGCSSLNSITLPTSVQTIGANVFESCFSLSSITIPEGVQTIENCVFQHCIYNHRTTKTNQKYPSVNL